MEYDRGDCFSLDFESIGYETNDGRKCKSHTCSQCQENVLFKIIITLFTHGEIDLEFG